MSMLKLPFTSSGQHMFIPLSIFQELHTIQPWLMLTINDRENLGNPLIAQMIKQVKNYLLYNAR